MANQLDHPFSQRISHLINLINFLFLIVTGLLIHSPFPGMPMNLVRYLHFIFAFFLIINGVVRIYYAFFGKYRDYQEFFLNSRDWKNLWPQLKYYTFLSRKQPSSGKYNPMQKLAYLSLPILTFLQVITGFVLYYPVRFANLAYSLDGIANVRSFHYSITWLLTAIIVVHIYLVFTEAIDQFWLMFCGRSKKTTAHPESRDHTA